jgi:hypothetical protein
VEASNRRSHPLNVAQSDPELFDRLRYWKDFRKTAAHLFPTDDSLRWVMRNHEKELADAGAVIKLGRGNFIDGDRFKAVALPLMAASAQRRSTS